MFSPRCGNRTQVEKYLVRWMLRFTTTASCGVATLIGKYIDFIMKYKIIDVHGRYIIISCEIQGMSCILAYTYAPNKEKEQVKFFTEINNIISSMNEDKESVLWGGVF